MDIGLRRKTSNICDRIRWSSWEKIFSEISNEEANQSKGSIRQDVWNLMNPYKLGHINYELSQQIFATIME